MRRRRGEPMQVGSREKRTARGFCDGGGLCSPGRQEPEKRKLPRRPAALGMLPNILSAINKELGASYRQLDRLLLLLLKGDRVAADAPVDDDAIREQVGRTHAVQAPTVEPPLCDPT